MIYPCFSFSVPHKTVTTSRNPMNISCIAQQAYEYNSRIRWKYGTGFWTKTSPSQVQNRKSRENNFVWISPFFFEPLKLLMLAIGWKDSWGDTHLRNYTFRFFLLTWSRMVLVMVMWSLYNVSFSWLKFRPNSAVTIPHRKIKHISRVFRDNFQIISLLTRQRGKLLDMQLGFYKFLAVISTK